MTAVLKRSTRASATSKRASERAAQRELERRLEGVLDRLDVARRDLHQALTAVCTAEDVLLRRRQECERAAELVAELAELAESLQRGLHRPA